MTLDPKSIAALVPQQILDIRAYHVPPAAGLIKLDAMENPYQLPAELKQQWLTCLSEVEVNRYPDPSCESLKQMIRSALGIGTENGLLLGNGSDELIQMIAMLIGGPERSMLAPTPTFSMYQLTSVATGSEFTGVPLQADFRINSDSLLDAIQHCQPACVFLAYPNNPTGNCFDRSVIEKVLEQAPGLVVMDEAYFSFCRRSFIDYLQRFPDLLIMRTLSKSGMAGLRLGMLIGHSQWIAQLEKVRLPYNINSLTQCSARFYLAHYEVMQNQADRIISQRQVVFRQLADLPGLQAYPSEANFILLRLERDAERVHDSLKQQGVLIRNLHRAGSPLENCLRVTIGTESDNSRFLQALGNSLNEAA